MIVSQGDDLHLGCQFKYHLEKIFKYLIDLGITNPTKGWISQNRSEFLREIYTK